MFSYFYGHKVSIMEWASKSQLLSNTLIFPGSLASVCSEEGLTIIPQQQRTSETKVFDVTLCECIEGHMHFDAQTSLLWNVPNGKEQGEMAVIAD